MGGYYGGASAGYGGGYGSVWGIRWIYALLILIVIVLQFGRRNLPIAPVQKSNVCEEECTTTGGFFGADAFESIDRSVLFIIVVFLLILCGGCWWNYGGGYGWY